MVLCPGGHSTMDPKLLTRYSIGWLSKTSLWLLAPSGSDPKPAGPNLSEPRQAISSPMRKPVSPKMPTGTTPKPSEPNQKPSKLNSGTFKPEESHTMPVWNDCRGGPYYLKHWKRNPLEKTKDFDGCKFVRPCLQPCQGLNLINVLILWLYCQNIWL